MHKTTLDLIKFVSVVLIAPNTNHIWYMVTVINVCYWEKCNKISGHEIVLQKHANQMQALFLHLFDHAHHSTTQKQELLIQLVHSRIMLC